MRRATAASVVVGAICGATLFAIVGTITHRATWGGVGGAAIGGLVGRGWRLGIVSSSVVWMCSFAVAGAFIGPGCDADALSSALWFGAVGAFIGYTPWRVLVALASVVIALTIHPVLFALVIFVVAACFTEWFFGGEKQATKKFRL